VDERVGDIITFAKSGQYDVLLHGCNCFNTMGSGVAKQLAEEWPEIAVVDRATRRGDRSKLGQYSVCWVDRPDYRFLVFNLYTQYYYGKSSEHHFNDNAFWHALSLVEVYLRHTPPAPWSTYPERQTKLSIDNTLRIIFPKIGAGHGGGDWDKTTKTIQRVLGRHLLTCVRFDSESAGV